MPERTDPNEAMRPNMNDRSEREFMGRMESNHAKLTEFSKTVESFTQDYQRLYATYTSYRDMLREVLAERDQLRAEVERLRAPLSEEQIWFLTNDGMRNAAGGIYESSVIAFARAVERAHLVPAKGSA